MTNYIKVADDGNTYPYNLYMFRSDNASTSFPGKIPDDMLAEYGVYPVVETSPPEYDNMSSSLTQTAVFSDGVWTQHWSIEPLSSEEAAERLSTWRQRAVVSPYQAKAALFNAGLLDDVEAVVLAAETPTLVKLAWVNATEFRRMSPMIAQLAATLNITDEQLDTLFRDAVSIRA